MVSSLSLAPLPQQTFDLTTMLPAQMATRAVVQSWDNSTRGLDASTALDYAKSLRILADITKSAVFTSLYQAGEGIYEVCDKVLVIDQGKQVYFGPAKEARSYMVSSSWSFFHLHHSSPFSRSIRCLSVTQIFLVKRRLTT
jgi:ABC-type multidrug transport system ATPase subunit